MVRSFAGVFNSLTNLSTSDLRTGAEGIKTTEQAAIYGGIAGEQYDPCYHEACDDISNVDLVVLEQMADAAAHAVMTFAMTTSAVQGTDKGKASGHTTSLDFKGHRAIR